MKSLRAVVTAMLLTAGGGLLVADPAAARGLRDLVNAQIDYWGGLEQGYVPFTVAEGQEVGDVVALDDHSALKRRAECFPTLVQPTRTKVVLPRYVGLNKAAASALFEIKNLIGLSGSGNRADQVAIVYSDASIEDVTPGDFTKALSKECEALRPLIENSSDVRINGHEATVVRTIVRARSNIVLAVDANADAKAKIDGLGKLLPVGVGAVVPLDANAQASMGLSGKTGIVLDGSDVAAVAFRPTHIKTSWLGAGEEKASVVPFDPSDEVQRDLVERATRTWANSLQ